MFIDLKKIFLYFSFIKIKDFKEIMIKKSVCLNMIVKDECEVIQRCLESVKQWIDYWVIVDTGSTDATQEIIKECLKEIPGELHERPWVDFSHNRNEALELARMKGDYLLFIDADEQLEYSGPSLPPLEKKFYVVPALEGNFISHRTLLADSRLDWQWKGILYESLICTQEKSGGFLEGAIIRDWMDGHRSEDLSGKFLADAKILEQVIQKEPENSRAVFHLANCYEGAKRFDEALKYYEKRSNMGGHAPELFVSLYRIALLQEQMKMAPEIFIKSYLKAFQYRPTRPEPLFCLAKYFINIKSHLMGYLISQNALSHPIENDYFYTQIDIYEYGLLYQLSECAFRVSKHQESYDALVKMLAIPTLPEDLRVAGEKNLSLSVFEPFKNGSKNKRNG